MIPRRRERGDAGERDSEFKLWPVLSLLPIIVVGTVKATGLVSIGGMDTTLLSVALLFAATTINFLRYPHYPVRHMFAFILFSLVVLLGVGRSDPGLYQTLKARDFILTAVVVLCIPVLLRDVRDLRGLIAAWFFGGTLVACLVLVVGGGEDLYGRAGIGEATLGPAYLSAAGLVVGGAALGERLLPFIVALPGLAACGVALVTIGSRGPMVAAAVGLAFWIVLRGVLRGRSLAVLLVVSGVALVGVQQASEAALSRIVFEDPSRQELWAIARTAFLEVPFLGLGWGDYSTVSWAEYPHNLFWETASELGLLGLLSVLALLTVASVKISRSRSIREARVVSAVAIVMLLGQQFSADLTNRVFWIAVIPCLLLPLEIGKPDATSSRNAGPPQGHQALARLERDAQQAVEPLPTGSRAKRAHRPQ